MRSKSNVPVLVKHLKQWPAQGRHYFCVFKMKNKINAKENSQGM